MSELAQSFGDEELLVTSEGNATRSTVPIVLLGMASLFPLVSWMGGGIPWLTDIGMLILTLVCLISMGVEIFKFKTRNGLGGIIASGGAVVWWCHDYMVNWFGSNRDLPVANVSQEVVARAAFCTILFVVFMFIGLRMQKGKKYGYLLSRIPEPNEKTYFIIIVTTFILGMIPYLFLAQDSFFVALMKDIVAMRSNEGAIWKVTRSGNLNYNWGAYLFHLLDVGQMGGILGGLCAILIFKETFKRVVSSFIWLVWTALAFGSGARGAVLFMTLPMLFFMTLRQTARNDEDAGGFKFKRYIIPGIFLLVVLAVVQYQGTFRNASTYDRDLNQFSLLKSQGNQMFTESLVGYDLVPSQFDFGGNSFPGAIVLRPIPDTLLRFGIGWIPRALWHGKPSISEFNATVNSMMSGGDAVGDTGGTVCLSVVGGSYTSWGIPGVIEIGLLYGWLCMLVETAFPLSRSKLVPMLFVLGLATWLFRCFRDLTPHDLYPLLIGIGGIWLLNYFLAPKNATN